MGAGRARGPAKMATDEDDEDDEDGEDDEDDEDGEDDDGDGVNYRHPHIVALRPCIHIPPTLPT